MRKVKVSLLTAILSFSGTVFAAGIGSNNNNKVVYGVDNRVEAEDFNSKKFVDFSKATAAQIAWSDLNKSGNVYKFKHESLQKQMNICPEERFSQQAAIGRCSGFLVAPDLLVTAGHCVPSSFQCASYAWVFGYDLKTSEQGQFNKSQVFRCKKVINQRLNNLEKEDFALIQLDRVVRSAKPLSFRTKGKVSVGDKLTVIGYPSGLPVKIADGAEVEGNDHQNFFLSDLDTFGGNSGSAVFNNKTGQVEGILVRGARDYVMDYSNSCYKVNECTGINGLGCGGESVSRISRVEISRFKNKILIEDGMAALKKGDSAGLEDFFARGGTGDLQAEGSGDTLIMSAIRLDQTDMLEDLLTKSDVEIDNKNDAGDTALHVAIKAGNYEAVKTLLEAGADYLVKDKSGYKAKKLAKKVKASRKIKKLIRKYDKWWSFKR